MCPEIGMQIEGTFDVMFSSSTTNDFEAPGRMGLCSTRLGRSLCMNPKNGIHEGVLKTMDAIKMGEA